MSKITLKQLAEHLGLTQGTVSRAINNYPNIAEKTRKRVQEEAYRLGYRPNEIAQRLATGVTKTIGIMLGGDDISAQASPFFTQLLIGMSSVLIKEGWDLTIFFNHEGVDQETFIKQTVYSGKVSGCILLRTLVDDERIKFFKSLDFPFVVYGRSKDSTGYSWYDIDSEEAFEIIVSYLATLGHEDIAYLGGNKELSHALVRRNGFKYGLTENKLKYRKEWDVVTDMTEIGGYEATKKILDSEKIPTAIACVTDVVAIGAIRAIKSKGLKVGSDVSVVGYDGIPFGESIDPPLTTMVQPLKEAGEKLTKMLLQIIAKKNKGHLQYFGKATLNIRESAGKPKL